VDINLESTPVGRDGDGNDVYLRDVWPSNREIADVVAQVIKAASFEKRYRNVFSGNETWNAIATGGSDLYGWDEASTYIQEPPFFEGIEGDPAPIANITGARVLALLGDSVTTDHISPAGSIAQKSDAGQWLVSQGVEPRDFNSYGSRRGNHEVMMRGTFANIRLRNRLVPGSEGSRTVYWPDGEETTIYEAAMKYRAAGTPLVILAGREYGTGSSRDWAAKGASLLGVHAVIAQSYERIHRSNLVFMGVLPLEFTGDASAESLGLSGEETFDISGLSDDIEPGAMVTVRATAPDGGEKTFEARVRIDTPVEVVYYRNGGILHTVLRRLAAG
jgi:aconitate hydratase